MQSGRKRITGVTTTDGDSIKADIVVLCGGQWSRQMAATTGVNVPLHSAEHWYAITKPIEGVDINLPVMRDPDALIYTREWGGGLCIGGFELDALPIFGVASGVPNDFAFNLFPDNFDHFSSLYEGAMERIPALEEVGI